MGVGWVWLSVNWLGDSRSRNGKTGRPQKLEGRSVRSQKSQVSNENRECGSTQFVWAAGIARLAPFAAGRSCASRSVFKKAAVSSLSISSVHVENQAQEQKKPCYLCQ